MVDFFEHSGFLMCFSIFHFKNVKLLN